MTVPIKFHPSNLLRTINFPRLLGAYRTILDTDRFT
jgi:hypothetical protein